MAIIYIGNNKNVPIVVPTIPISEPVFSWKPDIPDYRDYKFANLQPQIATKPVVDLRSQCSPVENQSQLGSCTANSVAGAMEFLEIKNKMRFEDMSRLFIYYNSRSLEGTLNWDSGATLRNSMKAVNTWGSCNERTWPYTISKYKTRPTNACYTEGSKRKVISYWRLSTLDEMKQCLSDGFPFVFGFAVYESFMSNAVTRTGIVPMPTGRERFRGGHAVMAVGYQEQSKLFLVRNSWGTNWGAKGYFFMPYDYLNSRDLSDDMWTARKGTNL